LSGQEVRLDVQLSSGMRVTGVVVNEAGAAVAEARVRIDGGGDMSSGSVTTDANGNFNFEAMAPGRYTFTASKAEYATGIARDVDITTGAPVRVTLTTGGTIYGHVRGLSDSELVKATVLASSPSGRSRAPVDYAGNFRIEGSPVGTVRVAAEVGGIGGGRTSAAQSVQVEPGSSVNVDIDFKSDTSVRGRVTRNGVPLVGAMVNFAPREARAQTASSTPTDESGSYTATGLEDGLYNVRVVDMKRMATYGSTYEVRGSGTYDIDVKPTTLRGRVLDAATDEPIAEAIVRVRPEATDPMSMRMVSTDSTGAFLIEDITAGRYHATVEKEGYGSGVADIIIEENNTEPLEMKLSKNSGVTMKVVDARDGRDLDATIEVRDAQNRIVYDDPFRFGPGSTGALRLPLAPGQYRAIIFASGYATRSLTVVSPSQPTIGLTPGGTLVIKSSRSALQRARLVDGAGQGVYVRFRSTYFTIDGSPGVTTLQNVAPGTYTLQVLSTGDVVLSSTQVTVVEGQSVEVGM
jgi:hypothetical protein